MKLKFYFPAVLVAVLLSFSSSVSHAAFARNDFASLSFEGFENKTSLYLSGSDLSGAGTGVENFDGGAAFAITSYTDWQKFSKAFPQEEATAGIADKAGAEFFRKICFLRIVHLLCLFPQHIL